MNGTTLPGTEAFDRLLNDLAGILAARRWTLVTAESCTGGWIAKCCTDLAGSSAWFERGFVTYSNQAKQDSLGVTTAALDSDGAVSRAVAEQMVLGARRQAGTTCAISVTGIAGPTGGTADKPVGTVWFGWSVEGQEIRSECVRFDGDRDAIRRQTVGHSLSRLRDLLVSG